MQRSRRTCGCFSAVLSRSNFANSKRLVLWEQPQRELLQVELEQSINLHHPLIQLGMRIHWASFELALGATYPTTRGAPGISTQRMVALHNLKYQDDLSDEK
jgi:hypothetical protein